MVEDLSSSRIHFKTLWDRAQTSSMASKTSSITLATYLVKCPKELQCSMAPQWVLQLIRVVQDACLRVTIITKEPSSHLQTTQLTSQIIQFR